MTWGGYGQGDENQAISFSFFALVLMQHNDLICLKVPEISGEFGIYEVLLSDGFNGSSPSEPRYRFEWRASMLYKLCLLRSTSHFHLLPHSSLSPFPLSLSLSLALFFLSLGSFKFSPVSWAYLVLMYEKFLKKIKAEWKIIICIIIMSHQHVFYALGGWNC